ncbi:SgcJ/EcaC family oxidoreductase [Bacillus mycoides]|uniref:SgcJ/EcaC family oxidoreductase n=1 Tax=Bacillus mycoides TaxID=1405 RepID=UPI003D65B00B
MTKYYNSKEELQLGIKHIEQTIHEVEVAFNKHDADELDRHFTLHASWVNVLGIRLSGWKQINEAHKILLAGPLHNSYAQYEIEDIHFIRSNVAIVHIKQYPTTSEGTIIENEQSSLAMYVMVKEKDTWKIASGQNTFVQ